MKSTISALLVGVMLTLFFLDAARGEEHTGSNTVAERISALTAKFKPGTPEEYEHIPAIWQESIAAAKRNDADEIVAILRVALPKPNEPLRDWQAVVLGGGVINGLAQAGAWPKERIEQILAGKPRLKRRWNHAIEAAVTMADDENIRSGTRYDALRMLGVDSFQRRGEQLRKYLGRDVNDELQAGAVAALADMDAPAAVEVVAAAIPNLTEANRTAAIDGLLRSGARAKLVEQMFADGRLDRERLAPAQAKKLSRLLQVDAQNEPQEQITDGGKVDDRFKELFNGRDLTGWDGDKKIWRVEEGLLTGETRTATDIKSNTFAIWTGGDVGDFELKAVFRLEGDNNSGIQYRSQRKPKVTPYTIVGYQADIHPAANWVGMLYDEGGRGIVAERGQQAIIPADGKKEIKPLDVKVEPIDLTQWTTIEVIAKGNRLIHKINGEVTVDITDDEKAHADARGKLALQVHAGPPMKVQYKSIKLAREEERKPAVEK
jgi:hypothetical protein